MNSEESSDHRRDNLHEDFNTKPKGKYNERNNSMKHEPMIFNSPQAARQNVIVPKAEIIGISPL